MKTKYEDILRNKTDEEIEILCHGLMVEEMVQVEQQILDEAELYGFMNSCCKFVNRIAQIPIRGKAAINVNLFCGMLADSYKKEYHISRATKCTIILALTYLICPIDLIPDGLPFVGMLDDIKVLCLAAAKLKKELDQYIGLLSSKNRAEFQEALDVVLSECDWQNG